MKLARLHHLLTTTAARHPARIAVEDTDGAKVSYQSLEQQSDALRDLFLHRGLKPGERVAICLPKSVDAVVAMLATSKAGGIYVPVDAHTTPNRIANVLRDCEPAIVLLTPKHTPQLEPLFALDGATVFEVEPKGLDAFVSAHAAPVAASVSGSSDVPAYILYTSGSTGLPKGAVHTHASGLAFVQWATDAFAPTADDRFSSHAPFHFDLSVLDLFVPLRHGATVCLIKENLGRNPFSLGAWIATSRISVWYSVPTILRMMSLHGKLDQHDFSSLRLVLFAGEVFPPPDLRALQAFWPHPTYCNLFGPTETNVCTWYTIPGLVPEERSAPFSIGGVCSHLEAVVVDAHAQPVAIGEEGELCVRGPSVMTCYWARSDATRRAFVELDGVSGWYQTGDYVIASDTGEYTFLGRRDRMVKRRGYRIQLGEIQALLQCHPELEEAAVVATPDAESGVQIDAVVVPHTPDARPSLIAMKRYCAQGLPRYMIPDRFVFVAALPRTSTDKIDYQALRERS